MEKFIKNQFEQSQEICKIDNELYDKYDVKRGLRYANGTGVLVALTKISDVVGYRIINNEKIDVEGHLLYRDVDIYDLAKMDIDNFGYERTCFLLLFGKMPSEEELNMFKNIIARDSILPDGFLEKVILPYPCENIMNQIQRSILALYSFDEDPDNTDPIAMLEKGISIIAKMPSIISYAYQAKAHYINNRTLHIRRPQIGKSIAENILLMSRSRGKFDAIEADTLDLALILHADHGGGNNSTFTSIVIGSTGTDIYSAISGSLGSLKGPRHGGANKSVEEMMDLVIKEITTSATDEQIRKMVGRIINKDFYDKKGLVYGIGHAVYTLSDPRAELLREKCRELSLSKDKFSTFEFYTRFEKIAIEELKAKKDGKYNFCANVDFYSGLTYHLLNIPTDLYTPIFATARIVGWVAHNIENRLFCDRIIRPASKYVSSK